MNEILKAKNKKRLMSVTAVLIAAIMILVVFNVAVIGRENHRIISEKIDEPALAYRSQMESANLLTSKEDYKISTVDSSLSRELESEIDKHELATQILIEAIQLIAKMTEEEIEEKQDKIFSKITEDVGKDIATLIDHRKNDVERAVATLNILGYEGRINQVDSRKLDASVENKPMYSSLSDPLMNTYRDLGLTLEEVEILVNNYEKSKEETSINSLTSDVNSSKLKVMPRLFSLNVDSSAASTIFSDLSQVLTSVVFESVAGFALSDYSSYPSSNTANPTPTHSVEPYAIPEPSKVVYMPRDEDDCVGLLEWLYNLLLTIAIVLIDIAVLVTAAMIAVIGAVTALVVTTAIALLAGGVWGFLLWVGAAGSDIANMLFDLFNGVYEFIQLTIVGEIIWHLFNWGNFIQSFINGFTWSFGHLIDFWSQIINKIRDGINDQKENDPSGIKTP
jgi:hypothetical protein